MAMQTTLIKHGQFHIRVQNLLHLPLILEQHLKTTVITFIFMIVTELRLENIPVQHLPEKL